jgi:hypothetical protein
VLLGRELDNGNTLFNHVKGFYPNGKGVAELVNMVYGKGVVKQTLDDAASDIVFRVYITPVQETAILKLFQTWNDKTYSLPVQNCIDFTKAVARATKLTLPPYSGDISFEFPTTFIVGLSQQNDKDTPLRGGSPRNSGAFATPTPPATMPSRGLDAARATQEQTQRALDAQRGIVPPNLAGPPPSPPVIVTPPPTPPTLVPPALQTPPMAPPVIIPGRP